jgi:hypothetical protein
MVNCIAERKLIVKVKETGERKELTIRIGMPYWIPDEEIAACPVEWDGLFERVADAKGIDLLQAIQLASNIDPMLKILQNKYDFFWPSGEGYFDKD